MTKTTYNNTATINLTKELTCLEGIACKATIHNIPVDTGDLPEATIQFLIEYGLKQKLADCIAGKKTADEKQTAIYNMVTKLQDGNIAHGSQAKPFAKVRKLLSKAQLVKFEKLSDDKKKELETKLLASLEF